MRINWNTVTTTLAHYVVVVGLVIGVHELMLWAFGG